MRNCHRIACYHHTILMRVFLVFGVKLAELMKSPTEADRDIPSIMETTFEYIMAHGMSFCSDKSVAICGISRVLHLDLYQVLLHEKR